MPMRPEVVLPHDSAPNVGRRAVLLSLLSTGACLFSTNSSKAAASAQDLFAKAAKGSSKTIDHSAWDQLLKAYVKPNADGINRFDYKGLKARGLASLSAYIARLEAADVSQLDRPEQFALLANLYNAKTIEIVAGRYPVKSIKDISLGGGLVAAVTGGPWKAKVTKIQGVSLSLDEIEHEILRTLFKDPRVHYAVNCASIGCPNLATDALTGAKLDALLDAGARAYINHPRGFSTKGGELVSSSIYSWFKADFGGTDQGVLEHARKYAEPALAAKLAKATKIDSHTYDWLLNDINA